MFLLFFAMRDGGILHKSFFHDSAIDIFFNRSLYNYFKAVPQNHCFKKTLN